MMLASEVYLRALVIFLLAKDVGEDLHRILCAIGLIMNMQNVALVQRAGMPWRVGVRAINRENGERGRQEQLAELLPLRKRSCFL